MTDDNVDNLQSCLKIFLSDKTEYEYQPCYTHVISKFSLVFDGTQTLQGKLRVRAHTRSRTHYTYMRTYVITNKDQAIIFFTAIQEKRVWNVDWDTTYPAFW